MKTICISVANITIRMSAEEPLDFSDAGFRGFVIASADEADICISVSDATGDTHSEADRESWIVGDCRDMEFSENIWEIGVTKNGENYIVVDSYRHDSEYSWVKMRYKGNCGKIQICRRPQQSPTIDPYIFPTINLLISNLLAKSNGFMIHSSVVDDGGKGYLFTAVSGTGKSTMAKLWKEKGATIVNDDMIAITNGENTVEAHNIPMSYYNQEPRKIALRGIFLISQSPTNFIRPISGATAVLKLAANTIYHPFTKEDSTRHIKSVAESVQHVRLFELGFKPDTDIVDEVRKLNL
ncbi:MAG: hypothetical protein MJZ01_05475 [Bacteroidales bacterium]|nr:hypothetical protein [Bacteroidales bacterium]